MLSREEVLKIAKLARLELTEKEVAAYQKKLGRVLEYVKELNAVETPKEFVRHVPRDAVAFREDRAVNFTNQKGLLENAPATEANCFLLPAIMEGD
jgi:aspartyl-tRNA(Asn)/glutamyl-tRNA(Gln) amidotransferase subunit C